MSAQNRAGRIRIRSRRNRRLVRLVATALIALVAVSATGIAFEAPAQAATEGTTGGVVDKGIDTNAGRVSVIVMVLTGVATQPVKDYISSVGGSINRTFDGFSGYSVELPGKAVAGLAKVNGVISVSANRAMQFLSTSGDSTATTEASPVASSMAIDGTTYDGNGVGVAVIDTGVNRVADLNGRLRFGPDFSGSGTTDDQFGHGTAMAGAIAGNGAASGGRFRGAAPKATVFSVKVAGADGVTRTDILLDALNWVVANHRWLNIKVANLSWGVLSTQASAVDPLEIAIERVIANGVTMVAAAGNSGPVAGTITMPGDDPAVLTVGAFNDSQGAQPSSSWAVSSFSSRGPTPAGFAKPDVVAPGEMIVTPKAKGSTIDKAYPNASVGADYIRGNGTSQATALTSGVVAMILQARPSLAPSQVKNVLRGGAVSLNGADQMAQGAGRVNLGRALTADAGENVDPSVWRFVDQPIVKVVCLNPVMMWLRLNTSCLNLIAQVWRFLSVPTAYVFGDAFAKIPFIGSAWTGRGWRGNDFNGRSWRGNDFTGRGWRSDAFSGRSWRSDYATSQS